MPGALPLAEAFGLAEHRSVWLIGGGGKTSLMFALARAAVAAGRTALTTTSTRIRVPAPDESPETLVDAEAPAHASALRERVAERRHLTLVADRRDDGKLGGFDAAALEALIDADLADHVLVEADGSAGRSLKAHREHEPVLSPRADLVVAVIGADCLGVPVDDAHVHRAALFRRRLGLGEEAHVTPADVAAIVLHRDGYLARVAPRSEVAVFLAGVRGALARDAALIAAALRERDRERRIGAIVIGDTRTGEYSA